MGTQKKVNMFINDEAGVASTVGSAEEYYELVKWLFESDKKEVNLGRI